MLLATVLGSATATVKHPSLGGRRLAVCQPLGSDGADDGEPLLVVDPLGGRAGDRVMLTSDGSGVRDLLGDDTTPVRWMVLGLADDVRGGQR